MNKELIRSMIFELTTTTSRSPEGKTRDWTHGMLGGEGCGSRYVLVGHRARLTGRPDQTARRNEATRSLATWIRPVAAAAEAMDCTRALPTTTASAIEATAFAWAGVLIPKPTATGR